MNNIQSLLTQKMMVLTWKDALAAAIPDSRGSYVVGSFPTVESASKMLTALLSLLDINLQLIEYYGFVVRIDIHDFQAVDEVMYLTQQNVTLEQKINNVVEIIELMQAT